MATLKKPVKKPVKLTFEKIAPCVIFMGISYITALFAAINLECAVSTAAKTQYTGLFNNIVTAGGQRKLVADPDTVQAAAEDSEQTTCMILSAMSLATGVAGVCRVRSVSRP